MKQDIYKKAIMKKAMVIFTACLLLMTQPAYSLDLQTAKSQGLVGETPGGYLSAVKSPSAETKALIENVNLKRKQKYQSLFRSPKDLHDLFPGQCVEISGRLVRENDR